MSRIEEGFAQVDGVSVFVRSTGGDGPAVVFAHGNPTHSADWLGFLAAIERPAIAFDLPGWGASERPDRRRFDYTMTGLGRFFGRCLDVLGVEEYSLVTHDWGAVALIAAQRHPSRLRRLVMFNTVPLLPGYRWHWIARYFWRVPGLGELANLTTTRAGLRLITRQATPRPGAMPEEFVDMVWRHWPRGAWPEMLDLYRSADPEALAAAGSRLGALGCPALLLWPLRDPYLPAALGPAYAERLPNAKLIEIEGAGHWPWIDRPELIPRAVEFLQES